MARRGKGRQRIVMQKMPKKSALQVTFSKRRSGLMKKASELCTLCAAQVLIVVFSPGGKVFSFGHPSTESIIRRFLGEEPELGSEAQEIIRAQWSSSQSKLNFHLNQLEGLVDAETIKGVGIDVERRETEGGVWWEEPMEGFNLDQMDKFMKRVMTYKDKLMQDIHSLQQNQRELNGGLPPYAARNGIYGGPVNGLPSSQAPSDPMMVGLTSRPPYDRMVVGSSSSQAPLDPRRTHRVNGGIQFDPMAATGSSTQNPRAHGVYGGLPYDPMAIEASNQMVMGSTGPLRFQVGPTVDPNTPRPSNGGFGASFDSGASDYGMSQGSNQFYARGFR